MFELKLLQNILEILLKKKENSFVHDKYFPLN